MSVLKSCNMGQDSPKPNISILALIPEWNAINVMSGKQAHVMTEEEFKSSK